MRAFALSAILAALLPLSGCQNRNSPPPPPPNKPGVEVHTPNVDVNANKEGAHVNAPGANVEVEKKNSENK